MSEENKEITFTEESLLELTNEALTGARSDIIEAESNVERYATELDAKTPLALDQYGIGHNAALTIKGQTRDRFLKLVNLVANRVKTKEAIDIKVGDTNIIMAPEEALRLLRQQKQRMAELDKEDEISGS